MARIEIDFEWPVAERYEGVAPTKGSTLLISAAEPSLRAVGKTKKRRPLEVKPGGFDAYLWVMRQPPTLEAYAAFAKGFGLLGGELDPSIDESFLSTWRDTIKGLRTLRNWGEKVRAQTIFKELDAQTLTIGAPLNVVIRPRASDGAPVLAFQPKSLRSALMLQCAQDIMSGAEIKQCLQCGQWFAAGGEGGKRADALFCSQACRIKFKNDRNRARAKEISA
jgi:hypothetical protein